MSTPPGDQRQGSSTPPAPRGTTPTPPRPRRFGFGRNWILFLIGALLLNIYLGLSGDEGALAGACAVQPVLPAAGAREQGQGHHVQRDRDPGHVQGGGDVQGLQADDPVPNGDSHVRRQHLALEAPPEQRRDRQREATRHGIPVVAEPPAVLRAHAPLRRAALLPHAPSRERAERPRRVRAFAGSPISAVG